jgi:4a-hydroxytetrahydrobiopterin dehydratase
MPKLNSAQISAELAQTPGWEEQEAAITRTHKFKDFSSAIEFVNAVARLAEEANHHPDIDIRWNQVLLRLSTHDQEGLTEKDFALARKINSI